MPAPIKHVAQADFNGCAVACVAMACGVTYEQARRAAFPRRKVFRDDRSLWLSDPQVVRAIERLGFRTSMARTFRRHRRPAIISFEWEPGSRSFAHSVVWDPAQRRLLEPAEPDRHMHPDEELRYLDLWRRSDWAVIVVTGRL